MQQFVVVIDVCLCRLGIAFHLGSLRLEEMAQVMFLLCYTYLYTTKHMFGCLYRHQLCSSNSIRADMLFVFFVLGITYDGFAH